MDVSIIVPAYNEEYNICELMKSIVSQSNIDDKSLYEVIIVDNGSTDRTAENSQQFGAKVYVRPNDSIADLRNYGASHAKGKILIFSDADNIFSQNTVSSVMNIFATEDCHALGPDGLLPIEPSTLMQRIWYFHTRIFNDQAQSLKVKNLSSGFFAIYRNVFIEVGGFNGELSIGEDSDLSFRLYSLDKVLLRTNKLIILNNGHPKNILDFLRREFWHGDSISHLIRHKNIDLLTIYLFFHLLGLILLFYCFILNVTYQIPLLLICCLILAPGYKSFKKIGGIKKGFLSLSGIYFLYLCARSAALFKSIFPKYLR